MRYRWLRYRLSRFILLLTLLSVWLGAQLNWIRDRHQVTFQGRPGGRYDYFWALDGRTGRHAPWRIRVLGERPIYSVGISVHDPDQLRPHERDELARLGELFPEADVKFVAETQEVAGEPNLSGPPAQASWTIFPRRW